MHLLRRSFTTQINEALRMLFHGPLVHSHFSRTLMRKFLRCSLFLTLLAFVAYSNAQGVTWRPDFKFPGTFFPSFAISSAGLDSAGPRDTPSAYGYLGSGSLAVLVNKVPSGTKLRVEIEIPDIGVSGQIEVAAPTQPQFIVPRLSWSQGRLAAISQPLTAEVIFRLFVDGIIDREERMPIRVRAITDAPLNACHPNRPCRDYSLYMAAFVNENHPAIDNVLRSALDIPAMPVKSWTGTQRGHDEALRQVWALWYLFQRNKVTYSSITAVSDERPDLVSQTVRPVSQTLRTSQANCIDGTVLFASILRKIGIEPVVVLIPGHAFLAFYTDSNSRTPVFLETTMINAPGINPFYNKGPTQFGQDVARATGSDVHMKQSWNGFMQAVAKGERTYVAARNGFVGKQKGHLFIDVKKAREAGILPIPL